jgi:hypothetical protein
MYGCGVHSCGSLAMGGPADQDPTGRRRGLPRRARARQRPARQARDDGVTRRRGARARGRHDPNRRGGTGDPETGRGNRRLRLLHRPDTRSTPGDILARRPPRPRRRTTNETRTPDSRQVPRRSTLITRSSVRFVRGVAGARRKRLSGVNVHTGQVTDDGARRRPIEHPTPTVCYPPRIST